MAAIAGRLPGLIALPSPTRAWRLVQRNLLVYRHGWLIIVSGFFEPLFYLLGIGFGLGSIIGTLPGPDGRAIPYPAFVAPALLASSCMNGAIADGFFNIFFKLNYERTYEGVLATPLGVPDVALGEMIWALTRGSLYAAAFLLVMLGMGLVVSPWALLALPAAILVSAAFSAGALAITGFVRQIQDFDIVMGLLVMPMFLFSGTFFPLSVYPEAIRAVVQVTPLYHAVALLRGLTTGAVGPGLLADVAYLGAMLLVGLTVATIRLEQRIIR
ncbi:MAG: ABC transporter permease [Chloroflexota bacterium]|nr:ABC transporter permease [Chloroflexota bacterium]